MSKIIFYCFLFLSILHGADAKLEIIKGQKKLPSITIVMDGNELEKKLSKMLTRDLEISGNFKTSLLERTREKNPSYTYYQAKQTDLLAHLYQQNQNIRLELYDINLKTIVLAKDFLLSENRFYPFVAHKIANAINDYMKAPSIDWMERKVVFSKLIAPSRSSIVVSDYTLTFQQTIIDDGLNIFPKWADAKQESIFFTKYLDRPTILKYDLVSKKFEKILSSQGMAVVSDVNADFKKILVSMAPTGQADIYLYDVENKKTKRITSYPGIDVGANFVENKKKIIFISDRLGYPNVFLMNEDGSNIEQVVFHGRNNSSATSNGKYVIYSSREEKNEFGLSVFNLYLIEVDGSAIRRLTLNGSNQMPRFSHDGENVIFLKNAMGQSTLSIIRLRYNKTYSFSIKGNKIQSLDW